VEFYYSTGRVARVFFPSLFSPTSRPTPTPFDHNLIRNLTSNQEPITIRQESPWMV
jgi:hypothetical protein